MRASVIVLGLFGCCLACNAQPTSPSSTSPSSTSPPSTVNQPTVNQPTINPPTTTTGNSSLALDAFRPRSMLQVKATPLTHAKFPVVDVHMHLSVRLKNLAEQLDETVRMLDQHQVAVAVSLDGTLGERFEQHKLDLWTKYRDRFVIFVNIDWRGAGAEDDPGTWDCHRPDFGRRVAQQLAEAKQAGASGLKIFKQLGLTYRNPDGTLIRIDDPRWDPIWQACGELSLPVLIHAGDPAAFFLPIDENNERWEELQRHPDWSFHGRDYPAHVEVLDALMRVVARHPRTNFIAAHVANNPENLARVSEWLSQHANLYVEIASRISELGRQPYTSRQFFLQHAERILFGTDGPWPTERLQLYWRFLETYDEYFPYSEKPFPPQGFWNIYGIGLPDEVLRQVYYENAARVVPGVSERLARWKQSPPNGPASDQ